MAEKKETVLELSRRIASGEVTVPEVTEEYLRRIRERDPVLHSFLLADEEKAMDEAERVEKEIRAGRLSGPLAGVPVAVKDNLCTAGMKTTCASRVLENFVPFYEAEAVTRLKRAGAVVLGKTNMDEFAMGSTTETSAFGPTKNPWNSDHVPGGSSGGSCAAVAAGLAPYAVGSDTGGSIRQPSSFCGVVGMKPTYGTVSRYGLVAYASSLDQIGPIAESVKDCAAVLTALAGKDEKDSTSLTRKDTDFLSGLTSDVRGLRVGVPSDYFGDGLDAEVGDAVRSAARILKSLGAIVEEFPLSLVDYAIPAYYTIATAEASSNLSRFDGVKYGFRPEGCEDLHDMYKKTRSEGFGPEVKRRIMLGSFVLSSGYYDAYYLKALRVKALIKDAFDRAFQKYDLILGPVAPTTAPRLGESLGDPLQMYLGDIYTIAVNLAGLPGISVPVQVSRAGLPVGVQLIGDVFREKTLLCAALALEESRDFPACPFGKKDVPGKNGKTAGEEADA